MAQTLVQSKENKTRENRRRHQRRGSGLERVHLVECGRRSLPNWCAGGQGASRQDCTVAFSSVVPLGLGFGKVSQVVDAQSLHCCASYLAEKMDCFPFFFVQICFCLRSRGRRLSSVTLKVIVNKTGCQGRRGVCAVHFTLDNL